MSVASVRVADKIIALNEALIDCPNSSALLMTAIGDLGPGCFFEDIESDQQADGAIKLLDWMLTYLNLGRI